MYTASAQIMLCPFLGSSFYTLFYRNLFFWRVLYWHYYFITSEPECIFNMDGRFDVRQEADSPFANMCFTDSSTVTRMLVSIHCLLELTKHKDGRISSTSNLKLCVRHCTTNVPFKNILARHNLKCFKYDTVFIFVCCDIFVLFVSLSHVFCCCF